MDDPGFDSSRGQKFFLSSTSCRLAVEPTQLPILLVLAAINLGVKRLGTEADHSPRARMIGAVHSNAHKVIAGFFLSSDPEVT
jgi:hypothetical protein